MNRSYLGLSGAPGKETVSKDQDVEQGSALVHVNVHRLEVSSHLPW